MATSQVLERDPAGVVKAPPADGLWALARRLHFYAGVAVAPFLVVAALTGLAYALTPQLDLLVYGEQLRAGDAGAAALAVGDQVAAARAVHPEGTIAAVDLADPGGTTRVVLDVEGLGEDRQRTVFVDPGTGEVRGALTTWFGSTPLTTWVDALHRHLHLGEPGRLYSEFAASWLWVVVLGGLVLWLARGRRYRARGVRATALPDLAARGVRRTRSWHAATGVWLALGLLFLSATGLTWSTYAGENVSTLRTALRHETPELDATLVSAGPAVAGDPGDIDAVLATARSAGLSGPVSIVPPSEAGTAWTVAQTDNLWPVRRDQVAVDPAAGVVTARTDWADWPLLAQLSSLGINAHMGLLFGLPNQLLLAAVALGLLAMIVWGYRSWWQRRPTRADRRTAAWGAPPARGAWRQVPTTPAGAAALAAGLVAVAAVGVALPVLGVTLAGFLLLDALLGGLRRSRPPARRPSVRGPAATL